MEKVSRFVEMQPAPVSRNEVEKAVAGKAEALRTALDVLTGEGYLEESKGDKRARLVESIRAYREDLDANDSSSSLFVPVRPSDPGVACSSVRPSPLGEDEDDRRVNSDGTSSSLPF
jgi:hypothetical protein